MLVSRPTENINNNNINKDRQQPNRNDYAEIKYAFDSMNRAKIEHNNDKNNINATPD